LRKYLHKERLSGGESHHTERVNSKERYVGVVDAHDLKYTNMNVKYMDSTLF
jgi:hypothetical protein